MKKIHDILQEFLISKDIEKTHDKIQIVIFDAFEAGLSAANQDLHEMIEPMNQQWYAFLEKQK